AYVEQPIAGVRIAREDKLAGKDGQVGDDGKSSAFGNGRAVDFDRHRGERLPQRQPFRGGKQVSDHTAHFTGPIDLCFTHCLYRFNEAVDRDSQEEPRLPAATLPEPHINLGPPPRFEHVEDGGDVGPVTERLRADIAVTYGRGDDRYLVLYCGFGEIIE